MIIKNGIVAMFDVLGFSTLIEEERLEDILGYLKNGFNNVIESNSWGVKEKSKLYDQSGNAIGSIVEPDKENLLLNYRYYFDTLIYFTEEVTEENFHKMISLSAKIIAQMYFFVGLPMRGGISSGELYVDDKNIFGKAIIDAHKYEKRQEWAGVMLSKRLIEECKDFQIFEDMRNDNLLIKYDVPIKGGVSELGYSLNWMQFNGAKWDNERFKNQWQSLRRNKAISCDNVRQKLDNTIKFREATLNKIITNIDRYDFGYKIII